MIVETYWIENGLVIKSKLETDSGEESRERLPPILHLYEKEGTDGWTKGIRLIVAGIIPQTPPELSRLIEQQGGQVVVGYVGTSSQGINTLNVNK